MASRRLFPVTVMRGMCIASKRAEKGEGEAVSPSVTADVYVYGLPL